ncbi:hypothetical protein FH609_020265 [Streptomyces sp. 3MP-14]|uniref:Uncharacterized protein n=1 Tax=Streptomyces mimosae TaxID=2586635 RepID=A0A5N6A0T2_9ACTN|nr:MULTISPECIES: hypothetical protein [Streptomyces]KAB8161812.1 hypothetical protein FH607_024155 [Streptomyces mimosae]KAB8174920.1 hypothetical protein FH609_020265 [Streptomyces sp. 3MP-14]
MKGHDYLVPTLVEVEGGAAKWQRARELFRERGWPVREASPRERRVARRIFGGRERGFDYFWADVPVPGSVWGLDREAGWQVARVGKGELVLQARWFGREDADRTLLPEWRVYSTRHAAWATRPALVAWWAGPMWWLRARLYGTAVRLGMFDVGERVRGDREEALSLARRLPARGPRTDVDVRPLDGRGRAGGVQHKEDAFNRGMVMVVVPFLLMALVLVVAREAPLPGKLLFGGAAAALAGTACWSAVRLPVASTQAGAATVAVVLTVLVVVWALGIPGGYEGLECRQALALAAGGYVVVGNWLLVRHWRWRGVLAGVLVPSAVTVLLAVAPGVGRFLHDAYADELGLTESETSALGLWQVFAAIKLVWPSLATGLLILATWGTLRYLHLLRPRHPAGITMAVLALVSALLSDLVAALDSPAEAAASLRRAAEERTAPPSYFGVEPEWVCITPTVPLADLNEQGGRLEPTRPYVSFGGGAADGQVVLWNVTTDKPLRVPTEQVRVGPAGDPADSCAERHRSDRTAGQGPG